MAYPVYYPAGCAAEIGDHYCNDCEDFESGRVSLVAFISSDFAFNDPTNRNEWVAGIQAKQIIIIPKTSGAFDGGSEVETPGYGRQATQLTGYNFVLTYNDPNYKFNADFYNAIKRSSNYKLAFGTETLIHLTETTVSIVPKNPVVDDVTSRVVWVVAVKWADDDLPVPYTMPAGLDLCFDYTGAIT